MQTITVLEESELEKRRKAIRRLLATGASMAEIGRMYGISRQRVQTIVRRQIEKKLDKEHAPVV